MSLVPYVPFRQLAKMLKEFDRFLSDFPVMLGNELNPSDIRVDVHENEFIATCAIPDLEKIKDVVIDIENNSLRISGSISKINEIKRENVHTKEWYTSSFHRSVALPGPVSDEGIRTLYKDGILEIHMPKLRK
jgi:HSP20 family protein